MDATNRGWTGTTRALVGAAMALGALLLGLTAPAETARAALRTTTVDGTTVTITTLGTHNWSQLSPGNGDTTRLRDGSRGEVWTFDVDPGQCIDVTMRSDDFDPYLSLRTGAPFGEELAHSDGAGRGWAKISGTAGTGPYYVTATSSGSGEKAGKYTLDVKRC